MDKLFYISGLIAKKNKGIISTGEWDELEEWLKKSDENLAIYTRAIDNKYLINKLEVYQLFKKDIVYASLEDELFKTKTIRFYPKIMLRYAAILIPFLFLVGVSWYYLKESKAPTLASIDNVIKPGSQKATLILSDGEFKVTSGEPVNSTVKTIANPSSPLPP